MTRIPELEQELVAAAARLRTPRRVLRPAARAALAAAAAAVVVLAVLVTTGKDDGDPTRQPAGTASGAKVAVDGQAGVQFRLAGRVLSVRLLRYAPPQTQTMVSAARIRATCGAAFAQVGPEGDPRNAREQRTRFWPAGRRQLRFRFARDISGEARWCRLEDLAVGHVAFVTFTGATGPRDSAQQAVELAASEWARLFAASDDAACERYMTQPACERESCERVGKGTIANCKPPSPTFRNSFRHARVEQVAIERKFAAARFSNGETVRLIHVEGTKPTGVWWIDQFGGDAGRKLLERAPSS
ncbi:MAG TPA: hypothetical protein VF056_03405 [Thermoleophilaceae bacterium]